MYNSLKYINSISTLLGNAAMVLTCLMVCSMLYEVGARYVFQSPTLWAFDISYMLNGSIFLLAGAYSLNHEAHVRIDFLSSKLPIRLQQNLNAIIYAFIAGPAFAAFSWVATKKAYTAFLTGEVENVSPWAPLVWPFYSIIALGLIACTIQLYLEAIKFMLGSKIPGHTTDSGVPLND
ncbi:TRAP transporter small permease subunit [Marinomonas sp. 15G1-11]|uniref:TRAP transporter small permease protein n=1 Tax=Marinomonas phaeophyticola TaxID=3004091 RepID=A0ABT4JSB0_9GAMM|nr:TRAP transporter small permease subunit [Marinomonas sp. 15G1-11]MCZ2721061.1 TRAP transporter small permease subunit [Marinomonas sp. 15G1-11]